MQVEYRRENRKNLYIVSKDGEEVFRSSVQDAAHRWLCKNGGRYRASRVALIIARDRGTSKLEMAS